MTFSGRELRSLIDQSGKLTLSLETVTLKEPADDEVILQVQASPINPSDIGLLLGPADISSLVEERSGDHPALSFTIPEARRPAVRGRIDQSLPVGTEGAGTVVAAGKNARALEGKLVGVMGGGMYADHRKVSARDVVVLPEGASAAEGASMFVNPLTALGFVETARQDGAKAIIHSPGASNLGLMLQKVCAADGLPLINIVRSEAQAARLRAIGATHIVNSQDADFGANLAAMAAETDATVAFDAIGGGNLGNEIMQAMERAAVSKMTEYSRYGSETFKKLYIYGGLDLTPTTLNRLAFGTQWSVSGWLMFPFLKKASPELLEGMRERVVAELTTTFASHYTRVVGLSGMLEPDALRAYERKATGEKFLVDPTVD